MSQANPSPVLHVKRAEVPDIVKEILLEPDIKWVAVEFAKSEDGVDYFDITPWNTDPR
jgi:hypothetical protein